MLNPMLTFRNIGQAPAGALWRDCARAGVGLRWVDTPG